MGKPHRTKASPAGANAGRGSNTVFRGMIKDDRMDYILDAQGQRNAASREQFIDAVATRYRAMYQGKYPGLERQAGPGPDGSVDV